MLALNKRFPGLSKTLPRVDMTYTPTPLHSLKRLSAMLPGTIQIKRDDLTGKPYGGNKPRKLEYLLANAEKRGYSRIATTGGIGSNHCLATTLYGRQHDFEIFLILFPQPVTDHVQMSLKLYHQLGAKLILAGDYDQMDNELEKLKSRIGDLYFIPAGGSNALGTIGFINAGLELAMQLKRSDTPPLDAIYIAAGTCGSLAGLATGLQLSGLNIPVMGVQVVDSVVTNINTVRELADGAMKILCGLDGNVPLIDPETLNFRIIPDYFGDGYGEPTESGRNAIETMKVEGISLEPTYTAKTFAAVLDAAERGENVLYWHTFAGPVLKPMVEDTDPSSLPSEFQRFFW